MIIKKLSKQQVAKFLLEFNFVIFILRVEKIEKQTYLSINQLTV